MALLAYSGHLAIWHLAVASLINGFGWATDNPVRRVMIGEVVGNQKMGVAMSIDVATNNASRMFGPTVGGLLLATVGIQGALMLSILLYATSLFGILGLTYRNTKTLTESTSILARLGEGLAFVRSDRRLIGIILVTIIYNMFGWPFISLVPVVAHDRLHLNSLWTGILASGDGVGAFIGAAVIACFAKPPAYARIYIGGVISYLVMLTAFALTTDPISSGAALVLTGIGGSGFSIMQATLVYLSAPPEMRSRLLGVLSVCIGSGPIGFLYLGVLADAIGASRATMTIGIAGLIVMALTRRWWRATLQFPAARSPSD